MHTKQATQNEDGTYNLTLTVKGSQGSETEPAKVDVLMIVDVSGSMAGDRLRNMQSGLRSFFRNIRKSQKKTSMAFFRKRLESYLPMFWKMQEYTNVRPREEKHSCVFLKHYKN